MKNLVKLTFGLLLTGVFLSGCKEAEELLYVNFDADYETEFQITVPPASSAKLGVAGVFSLSETIDPTTNSDYLTYIDNIKEVDIEEVSGTFIQLSKDVYLTSGTISVTNDDYTATWNFADENIVQGTTLVLDNEQGQWDAMSNIMLGKKPFTVNLNGEIDEDDAEFTVLFKIMSEVTATPLN
jgi:hypothetical protein